MKAFPKKSAEDLAERLRLKSCRSRSSSDCCRPPGPPLGAMAGRGPWHRQRSTTASGSDPASGAGAGPSHRTSGGREGAASSGRCDRYNRHGRPSPTRPPRSPRCGACPLLSPPRPASGCRRRPGGGAARHPGGRSPRAPVAEASEYSGGGGGRGPAGSAGNGLIWGSSEAPQGTRASTFVFFLSGKKNPKLNASPHRIGTIAGMLFFFFLTRSNLLMLLKSIYLLFKLLEVLPDGLSHTHHLGEPRAVVHTDFVNGPPQFVIIARGSPQKFWGLTVVSCLRVWRARLRNTALGRLYRWPGVTLALVVSWDSVFSLIFLTYLRNLHLTKCVSF